MKRFFAMALLSGLAIGCGGSGGDLEPTTDPDAIKREQERLQNDLPGSKGDAKSDAIRREQQRLRNMP